MKLLGIDMSLKDLENIYNEFAKKMDEVVAKDETIKSEVKKKS